MHRKATIAANNLRIGLAAGILFVIIYGLVQIGGKGGHAWEIALIITGAMSVVYLLSAIARIIHFVYEEW